MSDEMFCIHKLLALFCFIGIGSVAFANISPTATRVTASQRTDGSGIVDIAYTLTASSNCTVSIQVSNDGGNTWTAQATSFLPGSHIGPNISPGNRTIYWNSKADLPGVFGPNYQVKVTADDGQSPPISWVPISNSGFSGQMSRYETTNAQFAQYLNAALASNDVRVEGNYVKGNSGPHSGQNYYQLDGPGWTGGGATAGGKSRISYSGGMFTVDGSFENHPVSYVSWYGATAFASYYGWRLPTEWEWQAVAAFTDGRTYATGNSLYDSQKFLANYRSNGDNAYTPNNLPYHPWVVHGTSEVGYFGTFGYGMADMAGNVWEWTSTASGSYRILRGGGWLAESDPCKVSYRGILPGSSYYGRPQYYSDCGLGFRICR